MRISDWSSDVCSSDLRATDPRVGLPLPEGLETLARFHQPEGRRRNSRSWLRRAMTTAINERVVMRHGSPVVIRKVVTGGYWHDNGLGRRGGYAPRQITPIGSASGRERVCQSDYISGVADTLKTKKKH